MFHYTYQLDFPNGMKYIGASSSKIKPELDCCYLGSGRDLPKDRNMHNCVKTILGVYSTREEAIEAEIILIKLNNCVKSDIYYNKRVKTFDRYNHTAEVSEGTRRVQKALIGRSKDTHEYIRKAVDLRISLYSGKENRTPAMLAADKVRSEKALGIANPAKGHPGTTNSAFIPWYYIDNDGNYFEIFNTTKEDFATQLGISRRQLIHRFHYTNEHKPLNTNRKSLKSINGFTFGNLPRVHITDIG